MIKITSSVSEQLQQVSKSLKRIESGVPRALSASLNRAATGVRTEGVRKVRQTYTIKYGGLKNEIKISKANPKRMQALLQARGRNLPLIRFNTTPSKPPRKQPKVLKGRVKKGGYKKLPGAFAASLGKFQHGVFMRSGPDRRAPVQELYGPSVPAMLGEKGVIEHMRQEAERRMKERFDHEMNRALERL